MQRQKYDERNKKYNLLTEKHCCKLKKMKALDKLYQETLNSKVEMLLKKPAQVLKNLDDYGQETVIIENRKIEIGWWKYKINNHTTHIIYKTFRKTFIFLQKPYLQGIKIVNTEIEYLNNKELGNYD